MGTTGKVVGRLPFEVGRETVVAAALVLGAEILLVLAYSLRADVSVGNPLPLLYPFVWIDVAAVALLRTRAPATSRRRRWVAIVVAAGYFVVLGYFGGLFGQGAGMVPLHVEWGLPPGYAPVLLYDGSLLRIVLEPYKVVGYVTLAYLVYVTLIESASVATTGVVGLFSCVSCTWPLVATVATGLLGSSSAVTALVLGRAYGISTLVFLSAIALLYWRPTA